MHFTRHDVSVSLVHQLAIFIKEQCQYWLMSKSIHVNYTPGPDFC